MICVDCGADVEHLIGGSCPSCFTSKTPLLDVPEVIDLELCSHCGAKRVGSHWHDVPPDAPEEWVREEVVLQSLGVHAEVQNPMLSSVETPQDERHFVHEVTLRGRVEEAPVEAGGKTLLRRARGICDRCSRIAGGYYAAIIQLRATDRDVTAKELERAHRLVAEDLSRQLDGGNRFSFISKEGAMHGGWDYYIGDIDAARNVCRTLKGRLAATIHESAKLVGRREGEDVYRVTFLVRIRLFAPGDYARQGDRLFAVTAVHPKSLQVLDLETHQRTRAHESDLQRLGGAELVEEATLVTRDASGAQVVDPQTYRTVDVLVPDDWSADMVPVIRFEERLFWVPVDLEAAPNKS